MVMKIRLNVVGSLLMSIGFLTDGRHIAEAQSYQEMFDKADFVVIASAMRSKDTSERSKVLDTIDVVGVETDFYPCVILKGAKEKRIFVLHHYRLPQFVPHGPNLLEIPAGRHPDFLMFLIKEKNDIYAPVTGQTGPVGSSVIELLSALPPVLPAGE
jgi:hypothetical protein